MDFWRARAGVKMIALGVFVAAMSAATLWAHTRAGGSSGLVNQEVPGSAEARKTFEAVCASCHGLDGRGGERGPDLVSRAEVSGKSDADLREILEKGKPGAGMPSFTSYGPERLKALVGYLRTLQGRGKAVRLPGNPAAGKALFYGSAKCSECHMISGRGGFFGQDLTRYGAKREAADIRAAIATPDKNLDPRRGMVMVMLRDSRRLSGLVRNEDNFSLQLQTQDGTFHLLNKTEIEKLSYEGKSGMPVNYGTALSAAELDDLVSFLLRSAGSESSKANKDSDDDFEE
jgi:putative heme-binding domain-containing protein